MSLYSNILETVCNTPVVELQVMSPKGVRVFGKLEAFNPLGSVKDRLALGVIEAAERDGSLKPGQTVVEATSGNTGIGLAMVCARKGYPLVLTMAESFSVERRRLMRFLGAKVLLTPAAERATGMVRLTEALAAKHGWFMPRQFENEANADFHSKTTAEEILADFEGIGLDYFVAGLGTGGTMKGVARVLRERSPKTRIVAAEPENAALISSGTAQKYNPDGSPAEGHPAWNPHPIQGWTPDFIPKLANDAAAAGHIDEIVKVPGPEAIATSRRMSVEEGIFCGISGGATVAAALQVAADAPAGSTVLAIVPDTGERYLSTPLFESIDAEMNDEEKAIMASV